VPYYPPAASSGLPTTGGTMTGTITSTMGTVTANTPALSATQTWNNAAVTFYGIFQNVTNTASAAASRLIELQLAGATRFGVTQAGNGNFAGTLDTGGVITSGNGVKAHVVEDHLNSRFGLGNPWSGLTFGSAMQIIWKNNTLYNGGSADSGLSRNAAGVVEVNNGTAGTFRDLKIRDLIATVALNVQGASASVASGISIGGAVRTTVGAAGGASALPATPTGYLDFYVGSTAVGIPYYVRGA
jgi:hypothetical protein